MDEKDKDEDQDEYMKKLWKEMDDAIEKDPETPIEEEPEILSSEFEKLDIIKPTSEEPKEEKIEPTTPIIEKPKEEIIEPITPTIEEPKEEKIEVTEAEKLIKEQIEIGEKVQERLETERYEQPKEDQYRLVSNNMFFIIPSWGELLGYPTLGRYVNKDVAKIHSDIVIFFSALECAIDTEKGRDYYIFGLGYYYTRFELLHDYELQSGKYITDGRLLTCVVLSDFVYDNMASSKNLTLENDPDVIVAEKVIKVPMDLSFKTDSQKTFIKGSLMRNIFIPNKEIILSMIDKVRLPENYDIKTKGHSILSTNRDYYNKILVSDKMKTFMTEGYMNQTAGVDQITYGSDDLLLKYLSIMEQQKIEETIINIKRIYSLLQFDHTYLYSLLKNSSNALKSAGIELISQEAPPKDTFALKEYVLASAVDRLKEFTEWPSIYPRNVKEDVELRKPTEAPVLRPEVKLVDPSDYQIDMSTIQDYREPTREDSQFQLRREVSERVEAKTLPPAPDADIEEILLYVKWVIEENYDMPSIGKAIGNARDKLKEKYPVAHHAIKWELSKWENLYYKREQLMSLPLKAKDEIMHKVDGWIAEVEKLRLEEEKKQREENKQLERERLEKERIERERMEQERIEKEKQRLAEERLERERIEKLRVEQAQIQKQREIEQNEYERQEAERLEREQLEQEQIAREAITREKQELTKLKKERKKIEKAEKKRLKQEKKLEKQREKITKMKTLEEDRLKELKGE